jgi:hypothetical protein
MALEDDCRVNTKKRTAARGSAGTTCGYGIAPWRPCSSPREHGSVEAYTPISQPKQSPPAYQLPNEGILSVPAEIGLEAGKNCMEARRMESGALREGFRSAFTIS